MTLIITAIRNRSKNQMNLSKFQRYRYNTVIVAFFGLALTFLLYFIGWFFEWPLMIVASFAEFGITCYITLARLLVMMGVIDDRFKNTP